MTQPNLFDPPYIAGSPTSQAAAELIEPKAGTLRAQVLLFIRQCCEWGTTDEQIYRNLGMNPSTERPRRIELVKAGLIVKTDRVRKTLSGRDAAVYVAREYA